MGPAASSPVWPGGAGPGVMRTLAGRVFPDDDNGDQVSVALVGADPHVRSPAGGPQQGPGGLEILGS